MTVWLNKQLGKYQIKEFLGRGAMADVYRAFQPTLERDVALKVIHPYLATELNFVNRFHQEAKIVAALRHPGIVQVYDFEVQDDTYYMVMEYVPGENLKDHLLGLSEQGARLPPEKIPPLFRSVVAAVAYAHKHNVVHRDLKPSNILLTTDGLPVLTDFGLSRIVDGERMTKLGIIVGTPAYMSPEQGAGELCDERSDIYSLGVILYELATGAPPFSGDTPIDIILKHLEEPPPPPRSINPDLPAGIEQIIEKALEKDPAGRHQQAEDLLAALDGLNLPQFATTEPGPRPVDARCPYRGLQVFEETHADFFFGREGLICQLLNRLPAASNGDGNPGSAPSARFLAILGASGSGKSSLVRAGLIPALRQGKIPGSRNWVTGLMRPGSRPLEEMAACLAPLLAYEVEETKVRQRLQEMLAADGRTLHLMANQTWAGVPPEQRLLLVIDQFEELFTLCGDELERQRLIENLLYASAIQEGRVIVVLTMRADFYHRCAAYRDLAARISARQLLVGPMNGTELRRAIERPAQQVGLAFEPGLVTTILADVAQQPGALPLLQHALLELWERRQGRRMTLSAYQASGGVAGAIAQRADALYDSFDPAEQQIVRRIMLRLTQPGEGAEDTRRRARKRELISVENQQEAKGVERVVEQLANARLVTTSADISGGEELVEVSHEALIRGWDRLQAWIDEDRAALRTHRQLTEAAGEWEARGRDPSYLYYGARLAQAREWAEARAGDLNKLEQVFLESSQAAAEAAEREREAARQRELAQAQALAEAERRRAEMQTKASRRLRWLATGLVVVFLGAVGAALFAGRQRQEALHHAALAETHAQLALARQLAAQAVSLLDTQLDLALLLGLEASQVAGDNLEIRNETVVNLEYSPYLTAFLHAHTDFVKSVAFSPDGQTLASASDDKSIILWSLAARQPIQPPLTGHANQAISVAFSPDGQSLASGSLDNTVILWDVATGEPLGPPLAGHTGVVWDVAFSPDGQSLASGSDDRTIMLWDVAAGQALGPGLTGHDLAVKSVAFSPDGQSLASGSDDRTVMLWDVAGRRPLGPPLARHTDVVADVAFSPDGQTVASGSDDQTIILWDVATGQPLGPRLTGHNDLVQSVAFSPDGQILASGSADRTILLWSVSTQALIGPPITTPAWVRDLAFSPDGQSLAAAVDNNSFVLWDVTASRYLAGHKEWVNSVAFSPDGQSLASGSDDDTVMLWDIAGRQRIGAPLTKHDGDVLSVAFSPDGQTLASGSADETIILWDMTAGGPPGQRLAGHTGWISSVAFSPDGTTLASSSEDGTIRLWDVAAGQPVGSPLTGHSGYVLKVVFSPDGQTLASGGSDNNIIRWDVKTGQPIGSPLQGHTAWVWGLAFSPDGQTLASSSDDDAIILWDAATGRPLGPPLTGHTDDVWGVAFSPDGTVLASSSRDNRIILWDVATRRPLGSPLTGHHNWVWGLAFSPNISPAAKGGYLLASGGRDSNVILWRVNPGSWPADACRVANRNLSLAEWEQFLPEQPYRKTCPELPIHSDFLKAGREAAKAGDIKEATAQFRQALALDPALDIDPGVEAKQIAAQSLVEQGEALAKAGNIEEAAARLQKAATLDPALELEPEVKARQAAAQGLIEQGEELATSGEVDAAITRFQQALQLDPTLDLDPQARADQVAARGLAEQGRELAREGEVEQATVHFHQALALDPGLNLDPKTTAEQLAARALAAQGENMALAGQVEEAFAAYGEVQGLDQSRALTAHSWHVLCRSGSLAGQAAAVLEACERSVALAPHDGWMHDSRGVARALTGDYSGAIEDFQFFLAWFKEDYRYQKIGLKRENWMADLEAGRNPFDAETLKELRDE